MGVLRPPVREHDDDVGPPGGPSYGAQDPVQVRLHQWTGPRRHPEAEGPGGARARPRRLADRVEADEAEPHATALDDRWAGSSGSVLAGTERHDRASGESRPSRAALLRRSRPHGCWPGRRHRILRRAAVGAARACPRRSHSPASGAPGRESALQVADREVGPAQEGRHRSERRRRVRHPAGQHDVTHDDEPRAPRRSRTGSTPATRAATTVGPTASRGTTARVRGSLSTAAIARRPGRSRTTLSPRQRAVCPEMSLRACARVRSSCGRVACPTTTIGSAGAVFEGALVVRVGAASGDSDRELARSPPAGGSAHPASIAAAAASARSR